MNPIIVAADATEVTIPKEPGTVFIILQFPHTGDEMVRMYLRLYEDTDLLLSRITSWPSGPSITPPNELDRRLKKVLRLAFGDGGWLYLDHRREVGQNEVSQQLADDEARDERYHSQKLSREIDDFFSAGLDEAAGSVNGAKKRKRGFSVAGAIEYRKALASIRYSDEEAEKTRQDTLSRLMHRACTTALLRACGRGVLSSSSQPDDGVRLPWHFVDLFAYQKTRQQDRGAALAALFEAKLETTQVALNAFVSKSRQARFDTTVLAENALIVHRAHVDRHVSEYEYDWQALRNENRSWAFNRLLDALHRFKGADAWGFSAALRSQGSLIGELTKLNKADAEMFHDETLEQLRKFEFNMLPDSTPIFHFPAWLGWLLGLKYAEICKALGLKTLVNEDPGASPVLDRLSHKYHGLDPKNPDYDDERDNLEREARSAVTITLGHLRDKHKQFGNDSCLCEYHAGTRTPVHANSRSNEASISYTAASPPSQLVPTQLADRPTLPSIVSLPLPGCAPHTSDIQHGDGTGVFSSGEQTDPGGWHGRNAVGSVDVDDAGPQLRTSGSGNDNAPSPVPTGDAGESSHLHQSTGISPPSQIVSGALTRDSSTSTSNNGPPGAHRDQDVTPPADLFDPTPGVAGPLISDSFLHVDGWYDGPTPSPMAGYRGHCCKTPKMTVQRQK